jgi:hypothetical protein
MVQGESAVKWSGLFSIGALLWSLQAAAAEELPAPSPTPAEPAARATIGASRAADLAAQREAQQAKCWADLQALCPDIETRQERVRCIRQHRAKLPKSCLAARRSRGKPIREVCVEDVKKLCPEAPRGRAVLRCLLEKRPEVSQECGAALDARRGGPGPVRNPTREPVAGGGPS